jgi:hypothetical protein
MIPEQETYQQQLTRMRDEALTRAVRAERDVRAAEDELGKHRRQRGDLIERTRVAEARANALATTLDDVLGTFIHKVHPGYAGLQSMMIPVAEVEGWRQDLAAARVGCPDPIECDHEAALGLAEARIAALTAQFDGAMEGWGNESRIYTALIAAVRALADELDSAEAYGGLADGYQDAADRIRAILDGAQP